MKSAWLCQNYVTLTRLNATGWDSPLGIHKFHAAGFARARHARRYADAPALTPAFVLSLCSSDEQLPVQVLTIELLSRKKLLSRFLWLPAKLSYKMYAF